METSISMQDISKHRFTPKNEIRRVLHLRIWKVCHRVRLLMTWFARDDATERKNLTSRGKWAGPLLCWESPDASSSVRSAHSVFSFGLSCRPLHHSSRLSAAPGRCHVVVTCESPRRNYENPSILKKKWCMRILEMAKRRIHSRSGHFRY